MAVKKKTKQSPRLLPGIWDSLPIALIVGLAIAVSLIFFTGSPEEGNLIAVVVIEGEEVLRQDMSKLDQPLERCFAVRDGEICVTLEKHRARVESSSCPDQICVHTAWLNRPGQTAVCLPNRAVLYIETNKDGSDAIDFITRG